jgi:hypothetical protein
MKPEGVTAASFSSGSIEFKRHLTVEKGLVVQGSNIHSFNGISSTTANSGHMMIDSNGGNVYLNWQDSGDVHLAGGGGGVNLNGTIKFDTRASSGEEFYMDKSGSGGSGSEPTLRPTGYHFGFIGTSDRPFYRSYASSHVSTSRKIHKSEVQDADQTNAFDLMRKLRPRKYKYNRDANRPERYNIRTRQKVDESQLGVVIEEFESHPLAQQIMDEDMEGVNLYAFTSLLLSATQKLADENDNLRTRIETIESKI